MPVRTVAFSSPLGHRQAAFAHALLHVAEPVPPGLVGLDGRAGAMRFAIYRNNVALGLIEALKAAFPVVYALVGDDFFAAMAHAHAVEYPPVSPVMLEYGGGFPAFIARFKPAAALPYLADVARLEWAWVEAYHAADAWPLSPGLLPRVAREDLPQARLLLSPSLRIVRSDFPVVAIWEMHGRDDRADAQLFADGGQDALVLRPGAEVEIRCLPAGNAVFIEALAAGASVVEAMQAGLAASVLFDLAAALTGLIDSGAIIGIETKTQPSEVRR
jgi:hypothetical protein